MFIKSFFLFFLLFIPCILLKAQDQPENKERKAIDSLYRSLAKYSKNDTALCFTYNSLGNCLHLQFPDSALKAFNKSRKISEPYAGKNGSDKLTVLFKSQYALSLNSIGALMNMKGEKDTALALCRESLRIRREIGDKDGIAQSLHEIGILLKEQGMIKQATDAFTESLEIFKTSGNKSKCAEGYNELGVLFLDQGKIDQALDYLGKSLFYYESLGDKDGTSMMLNNLGNIYKRQGDLDKGYEMYQRCFQITKETGNKQGMSYSLINMGVVLFLKKDISGARKNFEESFRLQEELGDQYGMSRSLSNLALICENTGEYEKAIAYYEQCLKIQKGINAKIEVAYTLNGIGTVYLLSKKPAKAREYCETALQMAKEMGYPEPIKNAAKNLFLIHKYLNNYKAALDNYELYISMRDSINNVSTRKASIKSQLKYEYEKQAAADSVAHAKETEIKNVEFKKQEAEIKAKKNQQYALFGGLGLVLVFAGFMFNRWKVTQKQKGIIELQKTEVEEQKKIVEEKQKEILDSIHYAKRIQLAQIPSEKRVQNSLKRLRE